MSLGSCCLKLQSTTITCIISQLSNISSTKYESIMVLISRLFLSLAHDGNGSPGNGEEPGTDTSTYLSGVIAGGALSVASFASGRGYSNRYAADCLKIAQAGANSAPTPPTPAVCVSRQTSTFTPKINTRMTFLLIITSHACR